MSSLSYREKKKMMKSNLPILFAVRWSANAQNVGIMHYHPLVQTAKTTINYHLEFKYV